MKRSISADKKAWELRARRAIRTVKAYLLDAGFEVSSVRYNPGGIAVWGEVSIYARKHVQDQIDGHITTGALYVQASKYLGRAEQIMFRAEDWPEHLGGGRGHKRTGANRYLPLEGKTEAGFRAMVRAAFDARMV